MKRRPTIGCKARRKNETKVSGTFSALTLQSQDEEGEDVDLTLS
jgi:hypothetical protein